MHGVRGSFHLSKTNQTSQKISLRGLVFTTKSAKLQDFSIKVMRLMPIGHNTQTLARKQRYSRKVIQKGTLMDSKIRAWLLILVATLVIAAVTGVPDLKQPDLVDPIALIVFFLIDKRQIRLNQLTTDFRVIEVLSPKGISILYL